MPSLDKSKRPTYLPDKIIVPTSNQAFYNSTTWRKYSTNYRKRFPICEVSTYADDPQASQLVDHIIPTSMGGSEYHPSNHMPMCHIWHNVKRGLESKGFVVASINTDKGLIPSNREDIINKLLETGGYSKM